MSETVQNNIEETKVQDNSKENNSTDTKQENISTETKGTEKETQKQVGIEGEILPDETTSTASGETSSNTANDAVVDQSTETTSLIETSPQPSNMSIPFIGLSIIQCVIALFLIVVVLQQSKSASSITSSAIVGGSDNNSYWNQNKGRSKESKLAKMTVILGIIFFVVTISLGFVK